MRFTAGSASITGAVVAIEMLFKGGMRLLLAGIDIGTLTCRLLIGEVAPDSSMREIESDRKILRLGEGVDQKGMFKCDSHGKSRENIV